MNSRPSIFAPVGYKPDAALEAAKERELARLTRRHIEAQLATAKRATGDYAQLEMFDVPALPGEIKPLF